MYCWIVIFMLSLPLPDLTEGQDWYGPSPGYQAYMVPNRKTNFATASGICQAQGGTLIRMLSRAESDYFQNNIASKVGSVWLDYSDAAREGVWLDSTGASPGYIDWNSGEPNNLGGEDCAMTAKTYNWRWNDLSCGNSLSVLCQYSEIWHGPSPEGHYYYQVPGMVGSKADVALQCDARIGGILPRATSVADLQFAWDKAATISIPSDQGIWLDLTSISGEWLSSTGAGPPFTNWATGEPSGDGTCSVFFSDIKWRDTPCNCMQPYISHGSILEPKAKYGRDEQASVACDAGFDLEGDATITCTCKGQWAAAEKFPKCSSKLRTCAGFAFEGGLMPIDTVKETNTGMSACDGNYIPDGGSPGELITCNKGSTYSVWEQKSQTCVRVHSECTLAQPEHGTSSQSAHIISIGDKVTHTCSDGYDIRGSTTQICGSYSVWNATVAGCEKETCMRLDTVTSKAVPLSSAANPGDVATGSCWSFVERVTYATCLPTRRWSNHVACRPFGGRSSCHVLINSKCWDLRLVILIGTGPLLVIAVVIFAIVIGTRQNKST